VAHERSSRRSTFTVKLPVSPSKKLTRAAKHLAVCRNSLHFDR